MDNRVLLQSLREMRGAWRGVAVVEPTVGLTELRPLAERIAPLGWHMEFLLHVDEFPRLNSELADFPMDVVIRPVHTNFSRCVAEQKSHAVGAWTRPGAAPGKSAHTPHGLFGRTPKGTGKNSATHCCILAQELQQKPAYFVIYDGSHGIQVNKVPQRLVWICPEPGEDQINVFSRTCPRFFNSVFANATTFVVQLSCRDRFPCTMTRRLR